MHISFRIQIYIVVLNLLLGATLFAQSNDPDYKTLAQYSILKYALNKGWMNDWADSVWLQASIRDAARIAQSQDFKYTVTVLSHFSRYEIIKIADETNFQLHGLHSSIFAINKDDQHYRYLALDNNNIEQFVSEIIAEGKTLSNDDMLQLIDIFNSVYFDSESTRGAHVALLDSSSVNELKDLGILSNTLLRFTRLGQTVCQNRVYSIANEDPATREIYLLMYNFACDRFWVTKELLVRSRR